MEYIHVIRRHDSDLVVNPFDGETRSRLPAEGGG